MKRIAAPLVGGVAPWFMLERLIYPGIFAVWRGRGLDRVADARLPRRARFRLGGANEKARES